MLIIAGLIRVKWEGKLGGTISFLWIFIYETRKLI